MREAEVCPQAREEAFHPPTLPKQLPGRDGEPEIPSAPKPSAAVLLLLGAKLAKESFLKK